MIIIIIHQLLLSVVNLNGYCNINMKRFFINTNLNFLQKRTEKPGPKQKDNFQGCRSVQLTQPKKGVTSQKQNYKTKVVQDPEDKIYHTIMKDEKAKVCTIILAELNDKLMLTSWRP